MAVSQKYFFVEGWYKNTKEGWQNLVDGTSAWRIWHIIGSKDLRSRYARSRLGQFWVTLSTGISVVIMGVVWSILWKVKASDMLPFMAVSIILWTFISGFLMDATSVLVANKGVLLNQKMSVSTIIYSVIYRNVLILLHNIVIIFLVFLVFLKPISWQIFLFIPALVLTIITSIWVVYVLATLSARFRDLTQAIMSIIQLAFYITPVIWKPEFLTEQFRWLLHINPFAVYLSILRDPLLNEPFSSINWIIALCITFGGLFLSLAFIGKYHRRLLFWL